MGYPWCQRWLLAPPTISPPKAPYKIMTKATEPANAHEPSQRGMPTKPQREAPALGCDLDGGMVTGVVHGCFMDASLGVFDGGWWMVGVMLHGWLNDECMADCILIVDGWLMIVSA